MNIQNIDKLTRIGSEWQNGRMHRIYFNNLENLVSLEITRYGSGNVSSAYLDGEKISNSRADRIAWSLQHGKFWYDVNDGQFHSRDIGDNTVELIQAAIETKISE